jgi:vacuolar-type H+-ATPase subunit C/Vma6
MPLGVPQYVMPNARVRSMIGRLLTAEEWRNLYEARDLAAMLAILKETTYGPQLAEFEVGCPPCELLEARLSTNMALRFARVIDLTPEPGRSLAVVLKR